jgi:LPXTG-motif cell wall-anchored protein
VIKKVVGGAVIAALSLVSLATPALAVGGQGGAATVVLNPGGARLANGSDGIVMVFNGLGTGAAISVDDGNDETDAMEVSVSGSDQVYFAQVPQWCCGTGVSPVLNINGVSYGEAMFGESSWDSITVVSTSGANELIANGSTAAITSTTTGNATAEILYSVTLDGSLTYTVKREISYTYPNTYYDEVWTVTIPSGNNSEVDFYIGGDAAPGGTDSGASEVVTIAGNLNLREKNLGSGQYISYQQTSALSPFDYYFVGEYSEPEATIEGGTNLTNYVETLVNDHDAGIYIQWSYGTTPGTYVRQMRTKIGFNNEFELAETGVDASGLALAGLALAAAGVAVVVRRRARA